jgi:hypothetical protein
MFVFFLLFIFGVEWVRKMLVHRKIAEMKMRGAMGSAKALTGLKALKEIGVEVAKDE